MSNHVNNWKLMKKFKVGNFVVAFFKNSLSDTLSKIVGRIIKINRRFIVIEFDFGNLIYNHKGFQVGTSKYSKKRFRPFISLATDEEIELAAKQEAFDIIYDYFKKDENISNISDFEICRIQNIIKCQNKLISMYESERIILDNS